jgi:hypothetical protein
MIMNDSLWGIVSNGKTVGWALSEKEAKTIRDRYPNSYYFELVLWESSANLIA